MAAKLTLQINSLEALERLIGGDSEIEIDIRQSVAAAFAKKYLKAIVKEETFQKYVQQLVKAIQDELKKEVNSLIGEISVSDWNDRIYINKLAPVLKAKIREEAEKAAKEIIKKADMSNPELMKKATELAHAKILYDLKKKT